MFDRCVSRLGFCSYPRHNSGNSEYRKGTEAQKMGEKKTLQNTTTHTFTWTRQTDKAARPVQQRKYIKITASVKISNKKA